MLFNNRRARSKTPQTSNHKLGPGVRHAAQMGERPGFPMVEPFQTSQEVDDYLSGDVVTCLICGNGKKSLALHIRAHGITPEEYRRKYNIPLRRALDAVNIREGRVKNGLKRVKNGTCKLATMSNEERRAASKKGCNTKHRYSPGHNMVQTEKVQKWTDADYYRVPELMKKNDMTLTDVFKIPGLPSKTMIFTKCKNSPKYRKAIDDAFESLSFDAKRRAGILGFDVTTKAIELRKNGMSYKKIGEEIGMTAMAIYRRIHPLDKLGANQ